MVYCSLGLTLFKLDLYLVDMITLVSFTYYVHKFSDFYSNWIHRCLDFYSIEFYVFYPEQVALIQ